MAHGVVGARSGSFGSYCDRDHKPMRVGFAGSQPRPGQERRKGRCFGGSICQGGSMQKCTWLKVTQGGAYPRRQLAECPRAVPYLRSHVSRRVSLSQPGVSIWREKRKRGETWELSQSQLFRLPREGRSYLHGPWTECRVQGEEKTPSGSFSTPGRETKTQKGV